MKNEGKREQNDRQADITTTKKRRGKKRGR
jgi:hypothetical protein